MPTCWEKTHLKKNHTNDNKKNYTSFQIFCFYFYFSYWIQKQIYVLIVLLFIPSHTMVGHTQHMYIIKTYV